MVLGMVRGAQQQLHQGPPGPGDPPRSRAAAAIVVPGDAAFAGLGLAAAPGAEPCCRVSGCSLEAADASLSLSHASSSTHCAAARWHQADRGLNRLVGGISR